MKHSVPHGLGQELARKVARAALESYKARFADFKPTTSWNGEDKAAIGFSVKGMALNGVVEVNARTFELNLDVPFLLKPFQGTAVKIIDDELKGWVEKAKRGEIS